MASPCRPLSVSPRSSDVSSVALTSAPGVDNTYGIGDAVEATVTFSAAVDITGTPMGARVVTVHSFATPR